MKITFKIKPPLRLNLQYCNRCVCFKEKYYVRIFEILVNLIFRVYSLILTCKKKNCQLETIIIVSAENF